MNYYETLGVGKNATPEEIKAAYKRLANSEHPDKKPGNDEAFSQINIAYGILSDEKLRFEYDNKSYEKLANFLIQIIESGQVLDPIAEMRKLILEANTANHRNIMAAEKSIANFEYAKGRIKRKSKQHNIFTAVIDKQIQNEKDDIKRINDMIADNSSMLVTLDDYEYDSSLDEQSVKSTFNYFLGMDYGQRTQY